MVKKILAALVFISFLIAGCVKTDRKCPYPDSTVTATTTEIDSLHKLLQDSGIVATQNAAGFSYTIDHQGTGTAVTNLCSTVSVTYKGSIFNGPVFDSTATGDLANFQLGQVIIGWQKGLPLISKGGDITLYIPPSLGYGSNVIKDNAGNVIIPANSYLVFHVHLADVY